MIDDTAAQDSEAVLLSRHFAVSPARLFEAWTDPVQLAQWWGPPGSVVHEVNVDLRVGGRYRVGLSEPDRGVFAVSGVYREVRPVQLLSFTWRWERPDMDIGQSLVILRFRPVYGGTNFDLAHTLLPYKARDGHRQGWQGILGQLQKFLKS